MIERSAIKPFIKSRAESPTLACDPVTGNPLFVPKIGRESKTRKKSSTESIGEYLHSHAKARQETLQQKRLSKELEVAAGAPHKPAVEESSRKMVSNLRNATFKKIFELLDSDQDGFVTAQKLDLSRIRFREKTKKL